MFARYSPFARLPFVLALLAIVGCSSDDGEKEVQGETDLSVGLSSSGASGLGSGGGGDPSVTCIVRNPDAGARGSHWVLCDPNQDGDAAEVRLTRVLWGRLVDVYGLDGSGGRVFRQDDFLIGPDVKTGADWVLEPNPVTDQYELTILRDVTDGSQGGGAEQFIDLLVVAEQNLVPVADVGLPDQAGLWTMVPRNAAMVLQFDDLIDPATLSDETLRTLVGVPAVVPFEARLRIDVNHGGLADKDGFPGKEFYPTRVLVDATTSVLEALGEEPPPPINTIGFPPSVDVLLANVAVRIATELAPPMQTELLRNPSGSPLATTNNGTVDFGSPTNDVVRGARSGGKTSVTGDPFDGFQEDHHAPHIVGRQQVEILIAPVVQDPPPIGDGTLFILSAVLFDSVTCARTPDIGDVIEQPGIVAVVTAVPAPVSNGLVADLAVRLVAWPPAWDATGGPLVWGSVGAGPAVSASPFDPGDDRPSCFVRVTPAALDAPENPTRGVSPASMFGLEFGEPIAIETGSYDALFLTRKPLEELTGGYDVVPAQLVGTLDFGGRSVVPDLPLAHVAGESERLFLNVGDGPTGFHDLVGNELAAPLPAVELFLDPAAPAQNTYGHVSRFTSADEDRPFGTVTPLREWSGQHVYDLVRGEILPRPVVRFEAPTDRTQAVPGLMTPFALGAQTPLVSLGAKTQAMWRYADAGMDLYDPSSHNLDVEGLAWSPAFGTVIFDSFSLFEIRLSHSSRSPDEFIDPFSLFPMFPSSGVRELFDANLLDPLSNPPVVAHRRQLGYTVNPGDLYTSQGGTKLMPFPMNRSTPPNEFVYYTWRDTAIRSRAGTQGGGVPLFQEAVANGTPQPDNAFNSAGNVSSIGLPLLMEFRCWPDAGALGLNAFDVSIAASSSSRPYFRAFSSGGINTSGNIVTVDPDLETEANGGFNPFSNPPGQPTYGRDNVYYPGAIDLVVRISRSHSVWRAALSGAGGTMLSPTYFGAAIEPAPEMQPIGTRVRAAYRGLTSFSPPADACTGAPNTDALGNALTLDLYGDHYDDGCPAPNTVPDHDPAQANVGMAFLAGDESWHDFVSAIDAATYYQVRLTFEANAATGEVPRVSSVAMSWRE